MFPFGKEVWRIFSMRGEDSPKGDEPATLEEMQRCVDRYGPRGLNIHDPSWLSIFRINERLAAHYRVGRCFLAGDAAHIHSPAGGQGMNTGIQDAVNLGWKLAYALNGAGNAEVLLDSYEAERRPIARAVIAAAAQKQHLSFGASKLTSKVRNMAVSIFGNIPAVHRKLQVELSETEFVYRDGPLVALGGRQAWRQANGGRHARARGLDRRYDNRQARKPVALSVGTAPQPADLRRRGPADLSAMARLGKPATGCKSCMLDNLRDPQRRGARALSAAWSGLGVGASRPGRGSPWRRRRLQCAARLCRPGVAREARCMTRARGEPSPLGLSLSRRTRRR